ncbi:HNH endonuclease signature motif containing protein [Ilumatobacter coccineus]|uniref:HNH nuclease domain-containing protein n=1 Tax=Ilumatobacter coccineus (strain NBRC 103263 / KCTC 29153 / YM16-304) TaxID=1313172 RepID=A0A6C7E290_ILUCY|nr:HNH endonuclease signature motif containing protein [Ilumatobacter coccineus]BAN00970.1 hypothetical protein YM304_06560 [Ilumatobacter coccineus YM16-304]
MTPGAIFERAQRIARVRGDAAAGSPAIRRAMVDAREVKAWVDAQLAGLIGQLSDVEAFPEAAIADAARCSLAQANKDRERSDTLAETPGMADALGDGAITAGHVDAVTRGSKKLDGEQREEFIERVEALVDVAAAATVDQFSKRLDLEIRRLQSESGEERLTRQKQRVRVSTWTDNDGMWNIRGCFDPVTGIALTSKLDNAIQSLFSERVPEHCPSDPVEKNKFLAAHALARLVEGSAGSGQAGRPEFVAVIDATEPVGGGADGPRVDWPIPVEVPGRVLAEMIGTDDVAGVVVRNGVVVHAPGRLDLGRATRLANRAQRRALRGLYSCCAIPGCAVRYDRCKLHHIVWWRHGGRTDLDNLLPVCAAHHAKIHHSGWVVELGPHRELTLTLPDGQVMNTGPPRRNAA